MITPEEVVLLSSYSRSELIGGLILGHWARKTDDAYLRAKLTHHAAEEITHADYIAQALEKTGHKLLEVHDEKGNQYYAKARPPRNEMETLMMAEAFEPIALHHYIAYSRVDGVDPIIKATLEKIISEEKGHADWIDQWLANYPDQAAVTDARQHYESAIEQVYSDELERLTKAGGMLAKIADKARELKNAK